MSHIDLNDLYYFAQAVEAGGFSAAARKLDMPKTTLSRRIARLEERLGVKLIQRNTRQFKPTSVGKIYYQHCAALREEADSAQRVIEQYGSEPQGTIKLSCPVEILELYVNDMLVDFMAQYPNICLDVWGVNRYVDVVEEQRDFAIRAKTFPLPDSELIARPLCQSPQLLVASPALVSSPVQELEDLLALPSLSNLLEAPHEWRFKHPRRGWKTLPHRPRMQTRNLDLIKRAACAGQGIAALPYVSIASELKAGKLIPILPPDWQMENDVVHIVYPSRSGMLPSVTELLDFLGKAFASLKIDDWPGLETSVPGSDTSSPGPETTCPMT